jgi:hypothetical protein
LVTKDTWGPAERDEVARLEREVERERAEGRLVIPEGASWAHRPDAETSV